MATVGGTIYVRIGGEQQWAAGDWEYTLGLRKREPVMLTDRLAGYAETPQTAMLKGTVIDHDGLDVAALLRLTDATITLDLANGKSVVFTQATQTGEGTIKANSGEIAVEFTAVSAEEVR